MLYKQFAFAAFILGSATSAIHLHERHVDLEERGGYGGGGGGIGTYQFAPGIQTATGDTCGAAFGTGYQTCREASGATNRLCYNPAAGQECCSSSWSCPNGSFCMADGSCCPNGMDPASCGAKPATTSSAAATTSSSAAPTSSSWASSSKVTHNVTSSSHSQKIYPTTFANVTSAKPTYGTVTSAAQPTGSSLAVGSGAVQASLSVAGLIGAGLLAVLATF